MAVMFLVHHPDDHVGVAVQDISGGATASGGYRDMDGDLSLVAREDIPLGHKIALVDIASGDEVIEYGVAIGRATADIARGDRVHVHNLKGQRWAS